ncbi:GntR family transcriptional regulator [Bradyrhizobium cenepequi]
MADVHIRALTAAHQIKPTSTRCQSAWRPNLGRASTYRRGDSVQTTATSSVIRTRLRDLVTQYQLRPGTQLSISKLSESLRVSPTPIREALAHLHGEGLVTWNPNRGYFVPEITATEMVSLAYLLCALVESALRGLLGIQPANITPICAEFKFEIDGATSPDLYVARTDLFLDALLSSQYNEQLLRVFNTIRYRTRFVRAVELADPAIGSRVLSLTKKMVDSIRQTDVNGAIDSLREQTTIRIECMDNTIERALVKAYRSDLRNASSLGVVAAIRESVASDGGAGLRL